MADEIVNQLVLDATNVLNTFKELATAMGLHTQGLNTVVQAIKGFNQAEAGMSPAIEAANKALSAQKQFAADTANQLRSVFAGTINAAPTLAEIKKVNDAFAQLEKTLVAAKATPEKVQDILNNLNGQFTGADAKLQSALIAAKNASTAQGSTQFGLSFNSNQASLDAAAKEQAAAQAAALAKAQAQISQQSATQFGSTFNQAGADPAAILRFQTALQNFQRVAQASGLTSAQLANVTGNLGTVFSGAEGKVAAAALQVQKFGGALQGVQATTTGFGANLQSLVRIFTFQQALQGLGALQSAFTASIGKAIEFERAVAQISTISGDGDKNINSLALRVNALANEFGKPNVETATGLYHAFSNQVGTSAETTQFFIEALKFSKAAVTDVSSSVDALSAVQNAYGQSSAFASHNADVLFRTIDLGRVSAKELGDSFGRILPIAAQLGVSLEEVSAAISAATVQGVKFQDAQTQILNLLVASLKPTGDLKKQMDDLGFANTQAGIAAEGFIGFFQKIGQSSKTNEELAKLFPNIRGLRGELSLFGDSGKRLTDFLQQTKDSSAAANKAFQTIQFTNAEQVSNELAKIQNQITQGFGRDAVAVLATLNTAFGGVADKVVFLGEALALAFGGAVLLGAGQQLIALLASVAGAAGATAATVATITAAFNVAALAVAALGTAAFLAYKLLQPPDFSVKFQEEATKAGIIAAKLATDTANRVRDVNTSAQAASTAQVQAILQGLQEEQAAQNQAYASAAIVEAATTQNFKSEISQRLHAYNSFLNSIQDLSNKAATTAANLASKQAAFTQSIQDSNFDFSIKGKTPQQQAPRLKNEVNDLLNKAEVNQAAGNSTVAESDIQRAKQLAEQFRDITHSKQLLAQVEQAYTKLLNDELTVSQKQNAAGQDLFKTNQPIVEQAKIQLDLILKYEAELKKVIALKGADSKEALAIQQQITDAATKEADLLQQLTTGTGKVGKNAGGPALQKSIDDLRKLNDLPKLDVTLKANLDKFRSDVESFYKATPIGATTELRPGGTEALQNKIVKDAQTVNKGFEAQITAASLKPLLDDQLKQVNNAFTALKQQNNSSRLSTRDQEGTFDPVAAKFNDDLQTANKTLDDAKKKINDVFADPKSFNEFGILTADAFKNIGDAISSLKGVGGDAFQKILSDLKDTTKKATDLQQKFEDAAAAIEKARDAQEQLNQQSPNNQQPLQSPDVLKTGTSSIDSANQSFSNLDQSILNTTNAALNLDTDINLIGQSGITAGENVVSGLNLIGETALNQVSGVESLIQSLKDLASVQSPTATVTAPGASTNIQDILEGVLASRGGQFFAYGGQARGTDTIPAMLSPGEIVMKSDVSRKFFSQLMAMNAGVQPVYRANGGPIGDTFGDINVNINSSGPSDINARAIAQGIRREFRRNSIRNF